MRRWKMNDDNINDYIPSILNPRSIRKQHDFSLTQKSVVSRCSLSLKRTNGVSQANPKAPVKPTYMVAPIDHKENLPNALNLIKKPQTLNKDLIKKNDAADKDSLGFSCVEDLLTTFEFSPSFDYDFNKSDEEAATTNNLKLLEKDKINDKKSDGSFISVSSATELENEDTDSVSTIIYNVDKSEGFCKPNVVDQSTVQVSFGVNDYENFDLNTKNGAIKGFSISHNDKCTNVDCEVIINTQTSTETEVDENMNETETKQSPRKRSAVAISLEIKKQKLTQTDSTENPKVLILKTNAIEKITHVIVQPPNYKFVKRNIPKGRKNSTEKSCVRNGNTNSGILKQVAIDSFFRKSSDVLLDVNKQLGCSKDAAEEMSRNSGAIDTTKCDRLRPSRVNKRDLDDSPQQRQTKDVASPRIKCSTSEAPSPKVRNEGMSAHTPGKNVESTSLHFSLPAKSKSNKTSLSPRNIPHHKIVAGTHFAVDAFSYGEIPNVKHYFLTHFHSDHYSGLKKNFSKLLYCSKITADLCITRLGVNSKNIRIMNADEVHRIEGVEVAAVDANHCPGALMLVFTLPNGKTLLHTGDFRACPSMESYPLFWNKDIHTIYLDTTYCNPRYDFPTQDQSLEMALYILRQKKMSLEKAGKKFSSVLIVCGTYTIGKEKFFLGMSRRVGCSVWACPEKERVLQIVEGRACSRDPPQACQMHVVPMRDLTHEKLRSYLDSLQGAFNEVVAFKPSGWENGKNSSVEKDSVTIHGIPYSEHSSFSELIRFVKFLKPKQVVPTVDISGGVKAVQKYFPCPLVYKDEIQCQSKVTDYFSIHNRQQVATVT